MRGTPLLAQSAPDALSTADLKKLSLDQLMDIDVTSVSRHPEKLSDAASAIQVVTGDEIERAGATSLPEALRLAPNLDVAQGDSRQWAISARGFNTALANKLLVLMDGRTVYTPLFSGVFWGVQDYLLADLDRIEVISGPGGTLWGANAVNGVINVISKSAQNTQGLFLQTAGGSQLQDSAAVRYGGVLAPDVYFRVYAKYADRTSEALPDGSDAGDAWRTGQGGFRIDDLASPGSVLTLQGDAYWSSENLETGGVSKNSGENLLGRWSRTFSEISDLSLQLYYDRTHLSDAVPASAFAPAGILTDELNTLDLDFQDRFRLGRINQLTWGLGYRFTRDLVDNAPGLAFYPAHLDQNLYSGFAQDEIALLDNLSFTLGSKVEHNDYTGYEFEPSVRLQWNLDPAHLLWSAISRAVRTPSRVDRDLAEPNPPPALLRGGSDFQSETVVAYEVGYRGPIGPSVTGSISAFYNDYNKIRSLGFTPATIFPLIFENNLEGETHGLEFAGTYRVAAYWQLRGGYDLLKEHLKVKAGKIDLNNALNETSDPEQQFSVHSALDLPGGVKLDTGFRWVDSLRTNNNGAVSIVPSYFELDQRIAWQATKALELSLVGSNLLHDHHVEYGAPSPLREEIRRAIVGELTWRY